MTQKSSGGGQPFHKMHGLGNDCGVIDARGGAIGVTARLARALSDRRLGVGFDQLALIEGDDEADLRLTFFNADGSVSSACGNATRCIARVEMELTGRTELNVKTARGVLAARELGDGVTSVNMGAPMMGWAAIPLKGATDTLHLPIDGDPVATGMGNPHCTFFVEDANAVDLGTLGPKFEHHPLFPQRTNVQFAHMVGPNHLRGRVWERGTGVTLASGSSSCAVAVSAARRGLTGREVKISLDGGDLMIDWRDDGVWMTGPSAHVFRGTLTQSFLDSL